MLVCFLSRTFSEFEKVFEDYSSLFSDDVKVFALTREEPRKVDSSVSTTVVSEGQFLEFISNLNCDLSGVEKIFGRGFGGLRNACLFVGATMTEDVVFFDSDTRPTNDCIERYKSLFASGKKIVNGKYIGHAGGVTAILLEIISTLELLKKDKLSIELALEKLRDLLGGVPSTTNTIITGAGLNGGNAGVNAFSASRYCFFPTEYRIEDGCYAYFSRYFLGEGAFFSPINEPESSNLPIVVHTKRRGGSETLYKNLVSEAKGSVIAQLIDVQLLLKEQKSVASMPLVTTKVYENFLLGFFKEKIVSQELEDTAETLDSEIYRRISELLSLNPQNFCVSAKESQAALDLFFFSQRNWAKMVSLGQKQNFIAKFNEFKA